MRTPPIAPLMISGDREKHLQKASQLSTDSIILNLEDGVGDKELARENIKEFLLHKNCSKKVIVRVNALNEGGDSEIEELSKLPLSAIRVPKIRTSSDVKRALELMGDSSAELHLSIETKEAMLNLKELKLSEKVTTFYLGILDLFADLSLPQELIEPDNPTVHYILSQFLVTSKALDVTPVSFVYQDYKNMDRFREWLKLEKLMGYRSKGALSPTQADEIIRFFGYSDEIIKRAKDIVKLFEENSSVGIKGFSDEKYGFIDEPIYKGAKAVLGDNCV
jgi:citrate lyase subunit beta/citryl-CoA lyase